LHKDKYVLFILNGGQQEFKEGFFDLFYSVFGFSFKEQRFYYLSKFLAHERIIFVLLLVAIPVNQLKACHL
jgi:hypothetical protein